MDPDTTDAAYAQHELEAREYQEILANDPGYHEWIERIEEERRNEIQREGFEGF